MTDGAAPALSWEDHVALSRVAHGVDDRLSAYPGEQVGRLRQGGLVTVDGPRLVPTDLGRSLAAPEGRHR